MLGDSGEIPDDVGDDSDFNLEVDERGYYSDSESDSDEGEDPVGGTIESLAQNAGLPRNISEKVSAQPKYSPLPFFHLASSPILFHLFHRLP